MCGKTLKYAVLIAFAGTCACNAQLALNVRAEDSSEAVPVINRAYFVYRPVKDDAKIANVDERNSRVEYLSRRDEREAKKIENAACVTATAIEMLDVIVSGGIPVLLGKPPCWKN